MLKKALGSLTAAALAVASFVVGTSGVADAQKVFNLANGQIIFDSGSMSVGSQSFDAGAGEDQVVFGIANMQENGTFTVSSLQFPPIPPVDGPAGEVDISIEFHGGSGSVNPYTGATSLSFSITVHADGFGLGSNCRIGPIGVVASTANAGGVPYNSNTGRVTLADHSFNVPGSSGCNFAGEINQAVGIPSPPGSNHAVFSGAFAPIRTPAIVPTFTATPSSGEAPLAVAFNSGGTVSAKPPTYQWDFNGDGIFDASGPTANHVYTAPGTYTARLRVSDNADFQETTRTVVVSPMTPDVTITKSGSPSVIHGEEATYTLAVDSTGLVPANGATVLDTLPVGLTFVSGTGAGWSCSAVLQQVTCTSMDSVPGGSAFPEITIQALADGSVTGLVTNTVTVQTPGEVRVADNSDDAETNIVQPGIDLDIDKVHDADEGGLHHGERATYVLSVGNDGTVPAESAIFVTDPLPDGATFVSASGGLDWLCNHHEGVVQCFTAQDVAPGEQLDDIRIRVSLDAVASPLVNTATVVTEGDSNEDNNSATHTGEVLGLDVDYQITKVHVGDLLVGATSSYGIGVRNVGTTTGGGTVTVTDELPAGLTYVGAQGDGWTCGAAGQTVTCTHPGGVEAGDLLPGITLQVVADASAIGPITNTATVAGPNDANPANDSWSDPGEVRLPAPDLALTKSHVGNFVTQANGTYTLSVRNLSVDRADGPTTVVDDLPAGLTFVSASGTGWSCSAAGQQVTCTYAGVINGLATAPPISVVAVAPDGAPDIVVNTASLTNAQDTDPANNSASDPTRIDRRPTAATKLEAQPILLGLNIKGGKPVLTLLGAPLATLTRADGTPIAGKTITFKPFNQQEVICTAVTDAKGVARCTDGVSIVLALSQLRYTADFYGDLDYKASHDEAALLLLGGMRLL